MKIAGSIAGCLLRKMKVIAMRLSAVKMISIFDGGNFDGYNIFKSQCFSCLGFDRYVRCHSRRQGRGPRSEKI